MFQLQQKNWNNYSEEIKKQVEVIITDDCSPDNDCISNAVIEQIYPNMRLFKIKEKVPWNWLECRNIGAFHAKGDWILLTDMDHLVPESTIEYVIAKINKLEKNIVYQFERIRAVDNKSYHFHNDTFFISKKLFWNCGGYDEHYSGLYGTSGAFRRRLLKKANGNVRFSVPLVLYGREVIFDASTNPNECKRKEGRNPNEMQLRHKLKPKKEVHFKYPYEEININA